LPGAGLHHGHHIHGSCNDSSRGRDFSAQRAEPVLVDHPVRRARHYACASADGFGACDARHFRDLRPTAIHDVLDATGCIVHDLVSKLGRAGVVVRSIGAGVACRDACAIAGNGLGLHAGARHHGRDDVIDYNDVTACDDAGNGPGDDSLANLWQHDRDHIPAESSARRLSDHRMQFYAGSSRGQQRVVAALDA